MKPQDRNPQLLLNEPSDHAQKPQTKKRSLKLSLRTKATLLAIALGTLPVMMIGATAYYFANSSITKQIVQNQQRAVVDLEDKLEIFVRGRYSDIQVMSTLPIFADSQVRYTSTPQQKEAALNLLVKAYGGRYDSIVVFDLNGDVIAQSQGKPVGNHQKAAYFQIPLKTNLPYISEPIISKANGTFSINVVAPVKDTVTSKSIAVIRARIPVGSLASIVEAYEEQRQEFLLVDSKGKIFQSLDRDLLNKSLKQVFPKLAAQLQAGDAENLTAIEYNKLDGNQQFIAYAATKDLAEAPYHLKWAAIIPNSTNVVFAAQRQLFLTLTIGTGLAALLVGAIAAYLARRVTRPILSAADALEKLGEGELDTRVAVSGEDEIATLGVNINRLGQQIQTLLAEQEEATRQQLAAQAEITNQQAQNAEQQKLAKEKLQQRALELLIEVDPLNKGDLTIRANVTEDEIGTIADSYNATISSLRKIVSQVQTAALQMATTTSSSEGLAQDLSTEALRQTEEIAAALDRIEEMSSSIRAVADNAEQAEVAVKQATQTVAASDVAMNRTVNGILAIQETVTETAEKVKHLGESSQKISKVVNLISRFAAQTNLLALKASIEAARAGEEGRGFAVLADEVRTLATQSAQATAEIESLVTGIQTETKEVVAAMATGTEQVAEGTRLVDETRQSLNNITAVSTQISQLVQAIASAAVTQSQASAEVTQTMVDVAAIANQTSTEATQVSASFKELLAVAHELQSSAAKFKVS